NMTARVEFVDLPGGYYPGPVGADSKTTVAFVNTAQAARVSLGVLIAGNGDPSVVEVGDRVWNDQNSNGIQDPGEPGIPGVKLSLRDYFNIGHIVAEATTDANGNYYFNKSNSSLNSGTTYMLVISKGT